MFLEAGKSCNPVESTLYKIPFFVSPDSISTLTIYSFFFFIGACPTILHTAKYNRPVKIKTDFILRDFFLKTICLKQQVTEPDSQISVTELFVESTNRMHRVTDAGVVINCDD